MEALIPILIFVGGIIFSIMTNSENTTNEKRNIDPTKLNNPNARKSTQNTSTPKKSNKSFIEEIADEFKKTFQEEQEKLEQHKTPARQTNANAQNKTTQLKDKVQWKDRQSAVYSKEKSDSTNHKSRERSRSRDNSIERQSNRKDLAKLDQEKVDSPILQNDLTFDKKAVVSGVIFSEILSKPRSKR